MVKRTFAALAVAAVSFTGLAVAQENATLTLKSGEQVSGQLIDMGSGGFTVRVSGQDRQFPTNDVALIDFAGGGLSQADWDRVSGGQHIVWLRNGETLTGQLYDVGGTTPLRITMKINGADRNLTSSEISRIALVRPTNAVATSGTTSTVPEGAGIAVPATQQWTPTGLTVRRGEVLTINTTGEVRLSTDANDMAGSAGSRSGRFSEKSPMPRALAGALIGRIGNGAPFAIGDQTSLPMPASGQLFLGINDDHLADNQGGFRVQITRTGSRRR
jgi:small nuclear ribonucleoprotein (snRNP)-like protein